MICSSEKRFFTSNLRLVGDWTPNRPATQRWGDVGPRPVAGPHPCRSPAVRGSDYSRRAPTKSRQLARPAFGFEARDRIATLTSEAGSVDGATHLCNAGTAQWIRWMLARFGRLGTVAHIRAEDR